ncbi:hypothetical protein ACHAXR_004071 [Thalassiosira sp. AJA248-18]
MTTNLANNQWLRCFLLAVLPAVVLPFSVSLNSKRRHLGGKLFSQRDNEDDVGLYVHIPYCRRRCNYCDFAIVPIGASSSSSGVDDDDQTKTKGFVNMDANYKQAVLDEIDAIAKSSINKIRLRSIYFGGGTPSLAPLSTIRDIMHAILRSENAPFYLEEDSAEVTIEMDPGTFDFSYLVAVKDMGFNRISLGVQSFDDNLLSTMGRVHRSADVYRSIDMIGQVFGEDDANYSIDLISGVPGLTLAGWTETLNKAVQLHPRPLHMSLYDLQVEKGTTFGKWYGDVAEDNNDDVALDGLHNNSSAHLLPALPSAEDCAFMYSYASGYLRSKSYEHYEISSYAYKSENESHRSKHNQIYWQYTGQWYAIGLGATSNVNGVRCARPRALSDYIAWAKELKQNVDTGKPPWLHKESVASNDELSDENDNLLDVVMTRLRTSDGLDLDWVAEHGEYGGAYVEAILRGFDLALDLDLGKRVDNSSRGKYGCIRLNDPKGFLFSNNIISNVFVELSEMNSHPNNRSPVDCR